MSEVTKPYSYPNVLMFWKIVRLLFWLVGIAMLAFMIFAPTLGVIFFWNILIPIAPALLVIGTGFWRNVCPLATTALTPDRFSVSKKKKLSFRNRNLLNLIAVIALFLIIPLRHVILNRSGQLTAAVIISVALIAVIAGLFYERKSVWCSGLCPVHPVEKFYGSGVAFSLPNIQCNECVRCTIPCPDSTPNIQYGNSRKLFARNAIEYMMVGAFPGYIWGWFQLPDFYGNYSWQQLFMVYRMPITGALVTLLLYMILKKFWPKNEEKLLVKFFAAAAVSCYYWFRLPQLLGFSDLDTNGVLVDLSNSLPSWTSSIFHVLTTGFFFWWVVFRKAPKRSWTIRPAYLRK